MRIIYPGASFQAADEVTGQNGIKVNGTDKICPAEKQVKEKLEVEQGILQKAFVDEADQSNLPELLGNNRQGIFRATAHEQHLVTVASQRITDADHPLIVIGIIKNG
ncbi:MAG TPA: hypothetical protein VL307_03805 [Chitinophagaceae bacterium]|nr:hypothetical protein [Chitinophagaceae bacterium]